MRFLKALGAWTSGEFAWRYKYVYRTLMGKCRNCGAELHELDINHWYCDKCGSRDKWVG